MTSTMSTINQKYATTGHMTSHICGHETAVFSVADYATEELLHAAMEIARNQPCPACLAAGYVTVPEETPELIGSPKQIKWAISIRAEVLAGIAKQANKTMKQYSKYVDQGNVLTDEQSNEREAIRTVITKIAAQTKAGWWIDHRGDTAMTIMREMIAA